MKFAVAYLAALVLFSTQAHAQFRVEEAETTENRVVVSLDNSVFVGDVSTGDTRSAHSFSVDWGIIHAWTTGVELKLRNQSGSSVEFEAIAWNNTFSIFGAESVFGWTRGGGYGGLDVSLYTSFYADANASNDVGLIIGPVMDWQFGGVEFGVNFLFDVPIGGGDTDFLYNASAMLAITPSVSAGLEAHSEVVRIFDSAPDFEDQTHLIGPVLKTGFDVGGGQRIELTTAGLIGLTSGSPDFVLTFNAALDLY